MVFDYVINPQGIESESFRRIRQVTDLSSLSREQQQVVMRIVHSVGMPEIAKQVCFSDNACAAGRQALAAGGAILCDVEMVKQGITKRMVEAEPLCFLNHIDVPALAKSRGETRSMAALDYWQPHLAGSVVMIGNAPTALFRLLEMIAQGRASGLGSNVGLPALIIAMPVGFVGAAESKQALWDVHRELGIECITLLGNQGGSAVTASACNALLRCNRDEWY